MEQPCQPSYTFRYHRVAFWRRARDDVNHLTTPTAAGRAADAPLLTLPPLIEAMRPKQWTKNAVVLAGVVFAGRLTDAPALARALLGVVVFCMLASAVYLANDVVDRRADLVHPIKRKRPIPSGRLPVGQAITGAVVLTVLALAGGVVRGWAFCGAAAGYVILNLLYSWRLKHEVILDVFALSGGFVLRAVAGAFAVNVPISPWLYVCTVLLSLFLGLSKRRYELILLEGNFAGARRSLEAYTPELVEEMLAVVTSSTVVAYSLYTFFADNLPRDHSMMLTIPFVLYGLFRYLYLVHSQKGAGNPDEVLLRDVPMLLTVVLWAIVSLVIMYVSHVFR